MIGPARYAIGQQYMTRGKHPQCCTVVDILTTTNAAGDRVRIRYVSTHDFLGQSVSDYDVVDATIALGILA